MTIWQGSWEYSWETPLGGEDDDSTCPENYIIIDDTNSDHDDSNDDFVDEAGADIMESATEEYF